MSFKINTGLRILFLIAIIAVFIKNKRVQKKKITINGKLDISDITKFVDSLKTNLYKGKRRVVNRIGKYYPNFNLLFLNNIYLEDMKSEFLKRLSKYVSKYPINNDLKVLTFSFFEKDRALYFYLSGDDKPSLYPNDAAENPVYNPKKRILLPCFKNIYSELDLYKGNISDIEQIIISGFMYLVIYNSFEEIKEITHQTGKLTVNVEFDSGDFYQNNDV